MKYRCLPAMKNKMDDFLIRQYWCLCGGCVCFVFVGVLGFVFGFTSPGHNHGFSTKTAFFLYIVFNDSSELMPFL